MELDKQNLSDSLTVMAAPEIHPCKYCGKTCKGKQCRACHLKMVAEAKRECIDCAVVFYGLRKDKTVRSRCRPCQKVYSELYYSQCPDCETYFRSRMDDGRVFNRCFKCYRASFSPCEGCDGQARDGFPLCNGCYKTKRKSNAMQRPLRKCENPDCDAMTPYTVCRDCY